MTDDPDSEDGRTSQGRWVPPPFEWQAHSEAENRQIRDRQRSRARVLALLLVAFVVLMFAITFVKINAGLQ